MLLGGYQALWKWTFTDVLIHCRYIHPLSFGKSLLNLFRGGWYSSFMKCFPIQTTSIAHDGKQFHIVVFYSVTHCCDFTVGTSNQDTLMTWIAHKYGMALLPGHLLIPWSVVHHWCKRKHPVPFSRCGAACHLHTWVGRVNSFGFGWQNGYVWTWLHLVFSANGNVLPCLLST